MAERSFKREVQDLKLGDGDEFRGEGILAITKALLQSGVSYVGGYQGAPISHLMDVLADAREVLDELGVHFQNSASEAAAAAMLAASVHYPIRGAVTFKSPVGINVASDAIANLASSGVTGGALIIIGEDYGEGSSIMQERSHPYAMKSQVWLLDPRPNLPSIVKAVEDGFELSEVSHTPVMLEVRIRACHVHGRFNAKDNKRPSFSLREALEKPRRDTERVVLPPASYLHEREKVEQPDLRLHGVGMGPLLHDRGAFAIVFADDDQRPAGDAAGGEVGDRVGGNVDSDRGFEGDRAADRIMHRGGEHGRGRGLRRRILEVHAEVIEHVFGVGEHVHEVRDRRALIAADIGNAGLQQRLGDREYSLAAEFLALAQLEVLHLAGK